MSSDDVSAYEDDAFIQGKSEDLGVIYPKVPQQYVLSKGVWQCVVIALLLAILFVILGSFGWYYFSVASPLVATSTLSRLSNYYGIGGSYLPNNTVHALYAHDDEVGVTNEEEYILSEIFGLFDFNNDDCWSLNEFEIFIDAAVEPEHNFNTMDLDNNGVVTMKEIYFVIEAFDETDIYECDETDQILYDIFGYRSGDEDAQGDQDGDDGDEDRSLFYEYIGQLWLYQLDGEGIGLISKDDYVAYIEDEEWKSHNHNGDDCVDFVEFRDSFFSSVYYTSWKESMQYLEDDEDAIDAIYQRLDTISEQTISSLTLQTTPHEFDANIAAYHARDPSVSLLYSFPNVYFARDLMDTDSVIRRLVVATDFVGGQNGLCFGDTGAVEVLQAINGEVQSKRLKDVVVGELVFDGDEYTKVIAVEKGKTMKMIQLFVNNTYITLTSDHLLFDGENEVIRAGDLKIGDAIYNDLVVHKIDNNVYEAPSTPITMSGKIQVNGLKASCYIYSDDFAVAAHAILAPFRFISQYVNEYYPSVMI